MANISIIGNGNMGQALATVFNQGGHTVENLGRDAKTVAGDIVVLAVNYGDVGNVISSLGSQLAGKTVVDISNPVNMETFDSLVVPTDSSATAEIAKQLPNSKVIKAFNTNFGATLASGKVGANGTTVLIAGDDAGAKSALADAVTKSGLTAIDAGSTARARELESIGFLQIGLAAGEKIGWTGGFAVVS